MATRSSYLVLVSLLQLVQLSSTRFVFQFGLHAVTLHGECPGVESECETYLHRFCLREAGSPRTNTDDDDCSLGSSDPRFGPNADDTLPITRVISSEQSWPVSFTIWFFVEKLYKPRKLSLKNEHNCTIIDYLIPYNSYIHNIYGTMHILMDMIASVSKTTRLVKTKISRYNCYALTLQGEFQMFIRAYDEDIGFDDLLDNIFIEMPLDESNNFTAIERFPGEMNRVSVNMSFRVRMCPDNLYGIDCDIMCVAQNDSINGFYTCNNDGSIRCRPGFQNISNDCRDGKLTQTLDILVSHHRLSPSYMP